MTTPGPSGTRPRIQHRRYRRTLVSGFSRTTVPASRRYLVPPLALAEPPLLLACRTSPTCAVADTMRLKTSGVILRREFVTRDPWCCEPAMPVYAALAGVGIRYHTRGGRRQSTNEARFPATEPGGRWTAREQQRRGLAGPNRCAVESLSRDRRGRGPTKARPGVHDAYTSKSRSVRSWPTDAGAGYDSRSSSHS